MATCSDLVKGAFRRAGITRDLDEVRPREFDHGLQTLQDLYLELIGAGAFGRLSDVLVDGDHTAKEQERVLVTTEDAVTITVPETITDDDTGEERAPHDGSLVLVTDVASTTRRSYVYDAAYAAWTLIEGLSIGDFAPLSIRYRAGLEARLAVRLSEENGMAVTPELRRQEAQGISALLHRYDAPERATQATYY